MKLYKKNGHILWKYVSHNLTTHIWNIFVVIRNSKNVSVCRGGISYQYCSIMCRQSILSVVTRCNAKVLKQGYRKVDIW